MTTQCTRSFESWRVYPRVHYFRKRFLDLYLRFKRVIGSLPFNINFDLTSEIDDAFKWFTNDLEIVCIGNADLPKKIAFVDINADPQPPHSAVGSRVFLCYLQGHTLDANFKQTLDHILDYLDSNFAGRKPLFCIVDLTNKPPSSEQDFVKSYIKTRKESDVIFGLKQLEIATTVSDYLEKQLADVFCLINQCLLSVGIKQNLPKRKYLNVDEYVCSGQFHRDMSAHVREFITFDKGNAGETEMELEVITEIMETGEARDVGKKHTVQESIEDTSFAATHLSRMLRCTVLLKYCEQKFSIPAKIVNLILEELEYDNRFNELILKDKGNIILVAQSKHTKTDCPCLSLGSWISSLIQDLDRACETTKKTVAIMKKMSFEVKAYLEQTSFGTDMNWIPKPPVVPSQLRKELLSVDGVYCIGTVYNEFTIYLKPENKVGNVDTIEMMEVGYDKNGQTSDNVGVETTEQKIKHIMKQHGCHFPYALEVVRIELTAQMAVENGKTICSPWPDWQIGDCTDGSDCGSMDGGIKKLDDPRKYRFGTLGGFVEDGFGNLFGLTCAHVVESDYPNHEVFINEGERIRRFATSSPEMTFSFAEHQCFPLVDVAAVKVEQDAYRYCKRHIKDEEGVHMAWMVYGGKQTDVAGARVFKHGAKTGCTSGFIASADLELPMPDLPGAIQPPESYLIMIESPPDVSNRPFSDRGDSGSLVCFEKPVDNTGVIKKEHRSDLFALSMIQAGEMTVDGKTSVQSVSFLLATGLRLLLSKSNVRLTCPMSE